MKNKEIIKRMTELLISAALILASASAAHGERLKDIASIKGIRENQLVGYGLVVGLNGTGDKKGATVQSLTNMLNKMGIAINPKDIQSKNAAAVMVTASLPTFPKMGQKVDAMVSTIGDAKTIQGGTLLMSPLKGLDGKVYGVAQGAVSVGGFTAAGGSSAVTKNHPTVGNVPNGVTIEKEIGFDLANKDSLTYALNRPDFTTAANVKSVINGYLNGHYADAPDPSSIVIKVPPQFKGNVVDFVQTIESLMVDVDVPAKVVINERTGTVIIGENVKISHVAIAHGDLTIEIKDRTATALPQISVQQGGQGGQQGQGGQKAEQPQAEIKTQEKKVSLVSISGVTLSDVLNALNKLGVSPRDLIAILQSLKAAGALRAELEII
jgi:flagellar P-ring protein precursor FlgI